MPDTTRVRLGRKHEPPITLRKSDDLIAVQTRSTRSIRAGAVPSPVSGEVADGFLVPTFPEAGGRRRPDSAVTTACRLGWCA